MDALGILDRTAQRYLDAESYRDEGIHTLHAGDEVIASTFATEYSRAGGLRFRYVNSHMDLDLDADVDGNVRDLRGLAGTSYQTVREVLGTAVGVTFLTSMIIPPLFFPKLFPVSLFAQSADSRWTGWEMVDEESCHVVALNVRGMKLDALISEKTRLVHSFRSRDRPERRVSATYRPTLIDPPP